VQTFLPYPDFAATAVVLDQRRLGKQRVEALQVLRGLTVDGYGWRNHPAVLMWGGFEEALAAYGLEMCRAWVSRGFADTVEATIRADLRTAGLGDRPRTQRRLDAAGLLPPWLGREDLHRSHRSALLRKDPGHYGNHFTDVPDDLPYVWPVRSAKAVEAEAKKAAAAERRRLRDAGRTR
jgi:hypothetical protein